MKKWLFLVFLTTQLLGVTSSFNQLYRRLEAKKGGPSETFFSAATLFVGSPYQGGTLDINEKEELVVNFAAFDCVTFIENSLALSHSVRFGDNTLEGFRKNLEHIRYRSGKLDGYASRLHYFSDWIRDNEKKGILREITQEAGGKAFRKKIFFMSRHAAANPHLKDADVLESVKSAEQSLSGLEYYRIPKQYVKKFYNIIREGDIIAFTTSVDGLDISHTAIAVSNPLGIGILHASFDKKKVTLEADLYDYMKNKSKIDGIRIIRVLR